jgi:hypothetical protein
MTEGRNVLAWAATLPEGGFSVGRKYSREEMNQRSTSRTLTNIFVYANVRNEPEKQSIALELI